MGFFGKVADKTKVKAKTTVKKVTGYNEVKTVWDWIKDGVSIFRKTPSNSDQAVQESFDDAVARMNVEEADLKANYQNQFIKFYICLILLVGGCALVIIKTVQGSFASLLAFGGFGAIALSQMAIASFWMRRLAERRFLSFAEWRAEPKKWWPTSSSLPEKKKRVRSSSKSKAMRKKEE